MKIHIEADSLDELREILAGLRVFPTTAPLPPQGASIDDLELSVRTTNCLHAEGIDTIEHLLARSGNDLLRLPSMGRRSLNEVKEVLATRGLALQP